MAEIINFLDKIIEFADKRPEIFVDITEREVYRTIIQEREKNPEVPLPEVITSVSKQQKITELLLWQIWCAGENERVNRS